nr:MAG TPA: hypothetical protein [Caudoviricetes sp.]
MQFFAVDCSSFQLKVDLRRDIIMLSKYRRTMTNSVVVLFL